LRLANFLSECVSRRLMLSSPKVWESLGLRHFALLHFGFHVVQLPDVEVPTRERFAVLHEPEPNRFSLIPLRIEEVGRKLYRFDTPAMG